MQPQYLYKAKIVGVVDGDTVDAIVDLGFTVSVFIRFRLNGINTPETNDSDPVKRALGVKAKEFVTTTLLNKEVTIRSFKTDKYGRWLADIFVDGQTSINQMLIEQQLAVAYTGGARG